MKENIKLSESSWSSKLVKYIFGVDPKSFTNLCPYFWLTVAGILLIPFKALWDVISWPWRGNYQRFLRSLKKSELYYLKYHPNGWEGYFYDNVSLKYPRKPDWGILTDALKEKGISDREVDEYKDDYEKDFKKLGNRKNKLMKISKIIENISLGWISLNIILLGLIATTGLIDGIYYFGTLTPTDYLFILAFCCFIILVILYFKSHEVSYDLLMKYKYLKWYQYLYSIPLWIITAPVIITSWVLIYTWKVIIIWKNGILKFGGIFGKYLEAAYENYCPGIEWEEKGGEK